MQCGTYPARAAQAGIRLPPTLEADKPARLNDSKLANKKYQPNTVLYTVCTTRKSSWNAEMYANAYDIL